MDSSLTYARYAKIETSHTGQVNCLSLSPTASYVATGGEDGLLIVWDISTQKELRRHDLGVPVISIVWTPWNIYGLFVGCAKGICQTYANVLQDDRSSSVTTGAMGPIFCLDADRATKHVALGAGAEVHLAGLLHGGHRYSSYSIFPKPRPLTKVRAHVDTRVRPVSLHLRHRSNRLIVSYLNHGIVCWNIRELTTAWRIEPPVTGDHVGSVHSSISIDGRFLLAAMVNSTMDAYDISRRQVVQNFPYSTFLGPDGLVPKTTFLLKGKAVACGSGRGSVCIWDRKTGHLLQELPHDDSVVLEICTRETQDTSYMLTASRQENGQQKIMVWKADLNDTLRTSALEALKDNYDIYLQGKQAKVMAFMYSHKGPFFVLCALASFGIGALFGLHKPLLPFVVLTYSHLAAFLTSVVRVVSFWISVLVSDTISAAAFAKKAAKEILRNYLRDFLNGD